MPWWGWLAVAAGVWAAGVLALLIASGRVDVRAVARAMQQHLALLRDRLRDPRVPRRRKVVLALALAYLMMPIDLVPDFIPVVGQLDDAIVLALALRYVMREPR